MNRLIWELGKRDRAKDEEDENAKSKYSRRLRISYISDSAREEDDSVEGISDTDAQSDIEQEDLGEELDNGTEYDSWDMIDNMWSSHPTLNDEILRRCLDFCRLFPENYEFHKDDIIHFWIAQSEETNLAKLTEDTASLYFHEFEQRNIFQLSDYSTRQLRYRLNHSIFELLQQRNDEVYVRMGNTITNSCISDNTLHSSLPHSSIIPVTLKNLYQAKRLRTLLILHKHGCHIHQVPRELFLNLPFLRVLDFGHTNITELPNSIGNLKELMYLNLSGTAIRSLPNSLCSLYKMKTLRLKGCLSFVGLPDNVRKLINLQHLDIDVACLLVSMPQGIGDLTQLQSLSAFVVSKEIGCHITELKHMVNLSGSLSILRLENVSRSEEAKEAALDEKKYLHKLELQWAELQDGFELIQNLKPHTELKELQIVGYGGVNFPSWIGDPLFSELSSITIHNCRNCELLPPLGKLPFLYDLCISEMHEVKVIDHQFCGRNMDTTVLDLGRLELGTVSDSLSRANMFNAFSRLEKLTLNGMPKLERWIGLEEGDFPRLQKLNISGCPKLTALAKLSLLQSLQQLVLSDCPSLESFPNDGLPYSLQCLVIIDCPLLKEQLQRDFGAVAHIPNFWIDYHQISPETFERNAAKAFWRHFEGFHDIVQLNESHKDEIEQVLTYAYCLEKQYQEKCLLLLLHALESSSYKESNTPEEEGIHTFTDLLDLFLKFPSLSFKS